jgi:hypothetical protein
VTAENLFASDGDDFPADFAGVARRMSCGKKIILIFSGLLLLAALYVPYRVKVVSYETNPKTRLIMRTAFYAKGFMSLPGYLAAKGREPREKDAAGRYYGLDTTILSAEFGLILFLGAADYLLFCRFLGRAASGRRETEG